MRSVTPQRKLRRSWLALRLTPFAMVLAAPLQAQVVWEPVSEQQAQQDDILVPRPDGSSSEPLLPRPIVWEPVPTSAPGATNDSSAIVWTAVPGRESVAEGSAPTTTVVWEVIPDSAAPLSPLPATTLAETQDGSSGNNQDAPPPEVVAQEAAMPPRLVPGPPPPPPIQALNRSVAFADGLVGPDVGWYVPNGFRWSERWFADASIQGQSRRRNNGPFLAWNDGDAVAIIHANVLQTESWSVALNTSFRSVYQGEQAAGGTTQVGEGIASGFRIAKAMGDTAGIAFGGEQVLQWDDKTDTGRNLYLMASKGWWLGNNGQDYPLLIANGGFGTGRFANQSINTWTNPLRFACIEGVENRTRSFAVDNDLCWSPIGTISLVMDEWWGMFVEYRSGTAQAAASVNLTGGLPLRLTWGVNFAEQNEIQEWDDLTWVFRASFGF